MPLDIFPSPLRYSRLLVTGTFPPLRSRFFLDVLEPMENLHFQSAEMCVWELSLFYAADGVNYSAGQGHGVTWRTVCIHEQALAAFGAPYVSYHGGDAFSTIQ